MRSLVNGWICFVIGIGLIETCPLEAGPIPWLREKTDVVGDVLGIWQGRWDLFAPRVDKENHRIQARIQWEGQTSRSVWHSPDWKTMNCWQKFVSSREIEFYDRVRNFSNEKVWPDYCDFLKRTLEGQGLDQQISAIELRVVGHQIAAPSETEASKIDYTFYSRHYSDD